MTWLWYHSTCLSWWHKAGLVDQRVGFPRKAIRVGYGNPLALKTSWEIGISLNVFLHEITKSQQIISHIAYSGFKLFTLQKYILKPLFLAYLFLFFSFYRGCINHLKSFLLFEFLCQKKLTENFMVQGNFPWPSKKSVEKFSRHTLGGCLLPSKAKSDALARGMACKKPLVEPEEDGVLFYYVQFVLGRKVCTFPKEVFSCCTKAPSL